VVDKLMTYCNEYSALCEWVAITCEIFEGIQRIYLVRIKMSI